MLSFPLEIKITTLAIVAIFIYRASELLVYIFMARILFDLVPSATYYGHEDQ